MPDSSAAAPTPFIHLRTHSAYSLSEGALPVKQMAQLAHDNGMPALAITDTGNLFGALEFSEAHGRRRASSRSSAARSGSISATSRQDPAPQLAVPRQASRRWRSSPRTQTGYRNLMRLSSRAYLDTPDTAEPHVPLRAARASCRRG